MLLEEISVYHYNLIITPIVALHQQPVYAQCAFTWILYSTEIVVTDS